MSSEHLTYLREVLEHDAIGFGEHDQLPAAIEHFEALEHASEQYRKVMTDQAKRIEQLEEVLRPFAELADRYDPDDGDGDERTWFWSAQPKIGWLRNARAALEGKE